MAEFGPANASETSHPCVFNRTEKGAHSIIALPLTGSVRLTKAPADYHFLPLGPVSFDGAFSFFISSMMSRTV